MMNYQQSHFLPANLDPIWHEVFTALQEPPIYITIDEASNVLQNDAIRVLLLWNLAFQWVIKLKWKSNYKIPYSREVAKVMKPFGVLIYRYLELCIQCHSFLKSNSYPTAATWFWAIVRESQRNTIFRPINTGKTESLRIRREILNNMRDCVNPISKQEAPHEWQLIETAIDNNKFDNFERDYYKPFIKAYSAWLTAVKSSDWLATIRANDNLYLQSGQGKGKKLLDFKSLLPEN